MAHWENICIRLRAYEKKYLQLRKPLSQRTGHQNKEVDIWTKYIFPYCKENFS